MYKSYIGEKSDLKTELESSNKKASVFMWVSVGLAVGLVGSLIWAFTK